MSIHPDTIKAHMDVRKGYSDCIERNLVKVRKMRQAYISIDSLPLDAGRFEPMPISSDTSDRLRPIKNGDLATLLETPYKQSK